MKNITSALIIRAMASAGTVFAVVSVVGAGRKWGA
jgi:hypothetical protein